MIVLRDHSLNFKALENPWTDPFKRYFLGHFADNSDIFTTAVLVQEARSRKRRFWFIWLAHRRVTTVACQLTCWQTCFLTERLRQGDLLGLRAAVGEMPHCLISSQPSNSHLSSVENSCWQFWFWSKSPLNFQNNHFLFFKWDSPWILSNFEIKWVNSHCDILKHHGKFFRQISWSVLEATL